MLLQMEYIGLIDSFSHNSYIKQVIIMINIIVNLKIGVIFNYNLIKGDIRYVKEAIFNVGYYKLGF